RGARAQDAGAHARPGLRRRLHEGAARPGRCLRGALPDGLRAGGRRVSITPATDPKATTMDQDADPVTRLEDVLPIAPPETKALAEAETARMVSALRRLDAADWTR